MWETVAPFILGGLGYALAMVISDCLSIGIEAVKSIRKDIDDEEEEDNENDP